MIKIAAYCRVSTDKEDQANSFQAQQRYFTQYIQHNPDWELYEIYADEGITGTSTKKRAQFNRMISDAYDEKFSIILTKEVSRFSRNILDTISYTRELKEIGVEVKFILDGIHTMEPDSELRLSIMASIAQEESRKTSERVKWGQTRQMERGIVFGHSMLGYDVDNGMISVNPAGAQIVRLIFHKYAVEQVSASAIADFLTEGGYQTYLGKEKWKPSSVIKILKQEKYVGDLVQKKTFTPNYLTHEKKINHGQEPFIVLTNHHEPIVSRDLWEMAQQRLRRNNKRGGEGSHGSRYLFSGKIRCGVCGSGFVGRIRYRKDGTKLRRWSCAAAVRDGTAACGVGRLVRDDDAMQMLKTAIRSLTIDLQSLIESTAVFAVDAILAGKVHSSDDPKRIQHEIHRILQKKEALMDSYFSQEITKEDMLVMKDRYDTQLDALQQRIFQAEHDNQENVDRNKLKNTIADDLAAIFSGEIECNVFYKPLLHSITVFKDRHMELRLNGLPQVFRFVG